MRVKVADLERRLEVHEISPDGNCLFVSVARGLLEGDVSEKRLQKRALSLRKRTNRLLCSQKGRRIGNTHMTGYQILRHYLGPRRSIPAYCRRMESTKEWGDEPHIVGMAHLLRRRIMVYDYAPGHSDLLQLEYGRSRRPPLHLLRTHGNHYSALLPKSGGDTPPPE